VFFLTERKFNELICVLYFCEKIKNYATQAAKECLLNTTFFLINATIILQDKTMRRQSNAA
jgi:hypothetical protein